MRVCTWPLVPISGWSLIEEAYLDDFLMINMTLLVEVLFMIGFSRD